VIFSGAVKYYGEVRGFLEVPEERIEK